MDSKKRIFVSWQETTLAVQRLADMVSAGSTRPIGIIAIARGGLVPATLVAHQLGIKRILVVSLSSYEDSSTISGCLTIHGALPLSILHNKGRGWLIVDDIVDTGASMSFVQSILPDALPLCLFCSSSRKRLVRFFWRQTPQDSWIVFPWEKQS